jgi:hypothetical protein
MLSKAVFMISIVILPTHSFGYPAKGLERTLNAQANGTVADIDVEFLTGDDFEFFANFLW